MTRGERLKALMKDKNVSAMEIANLLEKDRNYVYKLWSDELGNIDINVLKKIADRLDVSIDYLQFGEEKTKIAITDTGLMEHLPKDLKEFILSDENMPFIVFAKQLKNYDIENISQSDMDFLISALQMHYQKHKNKK